MSARRVDEGTRVRAEAARAYAAQEKERRSAAAKKGAATRRARARFSYTPAQIQDELTDRIEQGWTNDRIADAYDDVGPNLRRWLNSRRSQLKKFWESF